MLAPASSPVGSLPLSGRSVSSRSARRTGSARTSSRKHLGLGFVTVPELPTLDPEQAILIEPKVPENKRFCSNPDCVDAQGNPTPLNRREAGWCPQCGKRYSFIPTLTAGDVVSGQYEVCGCLAFGGLGWIYLAKDKVLGRWVVLKGLLNTEDEAAAQAAIAERQFLAAVKHANIVGIYNFVSHGSEGFIVMEYIAGTSLKDLRKKRGPLPPAEAIAYVHRILGAFAYLHQLGLVYCDFKPDNFMLEGNPPDVKLIDMGGVRKIDDTHGDVYGTRGYSAPEASEAPTIASDLYTVGRTLAVLLMDFHFQSSQQYALPSPAEQTVLGQHESLYRFLFKATARNPDQRFQSADEMAEQLGGVLRDIVADSATPRPFESARFLGDVLALRAENQADLEKPSFRLLPELKANADDPGAGLLLSVAAVAEPARQVALLKEAVVRVPDSAELHLCLARGLIELDSFGAAEAHLALVQANDPFDWRTTWYRGIGLLAREEPREAMAAFECVYSELPGELAPRLALAMAAELAGDGPLATRLYDRVSRIDPGYVSASLGLARVLAKAGKRQEAVAAYQRVPPTSSLHALAQAASARTLLGNLPAPPNTEEVRQASAVIEALKLEGLELVMLRASLLENALALVMARAAIDPATRVLGQPLQEVPLRRGLEQAFRQLARLVTDRDQQILLIDQANAVRPWTLI